MDSFVDGNSVAVYLLSNHTETVTSLSFDFIPNAVRLSRSYVCQNLADNLICQLQEIHDVEKGQDSLEADECGRMIDLSFLN